MNPIDLTTIQILDDKEFLSGRRVSMTKIKEAVDSFKAITGLYPSIILVNEEQYYAYERTLWDFIQSYLFSKKVALPSRLTFDGMPLKIKALGDIIDDGTTDVFIETPEGWKCDRKGCVADYKHIHTTYGGLIPE